MIFINRIIADYLKDRDFVIVAKWRMRHLTNNKEEIILYENGKQIKLGKCVVSLIQGERINDFRLKEYLKIYVYYSGFKNVEDWYNYIMDIIYNNEKHVGLYFYIIKKV